MLIRELIDRVKTLYSKGVSNDQTKLSDRHIYNVLLSVRMALLTQQLKKKQRISDWNYTVLPCVELIKVPATECSCLGDLGCDVYRTKFKIPKILTDSNRHYIEFVMSVENGKKFEEVTRQGVLYLKGNKYTQVKPKYLFENGYLYFPINKSPGIVKIKLLPEDPIEAAKFPSMCDACTDCVDCKPAFDYEFPIDGDLIKPLIELSMVEAEHKEDKIDEPKGNKGT